MTQRGISSSMEYTARELASKLTVCAADRALAQRKVIIASAALHRIARGEWTAEGARIDARKALDEIGRALQEQK